MYNIYLEYILYKIYNIYFKYNLIKRYNIYLGNIKYNII